MGPPPSIDDIGIVNRVSARLSDEARPSLRQVINLTGTVLHTNLGRAPLPPEAIEAVALAARGASNLEYDLGTGKRGERDDHVESQLCRLTGAGAATLVNNNAAAIMLVLNSLALRKEVPTSRGELIEIGGSFRLPDIVARSGCRLREVGTTNRTHLRDFEEAIGPRTGLVMKVCTSNYVIDGFTASPAESALARLCRDRGVPFVVDLGSGSLVDLRRFGLPHEPTVRQTLENGADIVTFSGDKLLGGPQAGIIAGRKDLIERIRRNPMKRALRVDKLTIAALAAVLRLYTDPARLVARHPALRQLARPLEHIRASAERMLPVLAAALDGIASVEIVDCDSQIGSGALPSGKLASAGLAVRPLRAGRSGTALNNLAAAFRALPTPVIGRIEDRRFILDLRCLDEESTFAAQASSLQPRTGATG
jgi:L-seryl-tRNA(Ser) seleniumtransferase